MVRRRVLHGSIQVAMDWEVILHRFRGALREHLSWKRAMGEQTTGTGSNTTKPRIYTDEDRRQGRAWSPARAGRRCR